jgi:WD40 repeat protein/transcriptional regulator with XRE-family HTH domain
MSTHIPAIALDQFATFGDLLKYLRRRAGLTQRELSVAVGYSDAMICRLEQNQRLPDIATLTARFVPALGASEEPAVAARLVELAAAVRREDAPAVGLPPFKGLLYFDEADAELFFGREALVEKLVARLTGPNFPEPSPGADDSGPPPASPAFGRFLSVVGASGSGKSSLVRAGIVPALRWNPRYAGWPIYVMTPTAHPLESLAASLSLEAHSSLASARLVDELLSDPRALPRYVRRLLAVSAAPAVAGAGQRPEPGHLVLIVDQFEELFTLCRSETERRAFVDNLVAAAFHPDRPVAVVIALRADFYAHCADFPNLREVLAGHQEYIGGMTAEELRRAIEEPTRRGGWEMELGLVDVLLKDVGADGARAPEPGALPLLSHGLLETWQRRRGRVLTLSGYTASGGVRGAIAETAEAVFNDQLDPAQRSIARRIFLRLTALGEDEGLTDTRRRVALAELILKPEETAAVREVLTLLADARLITTEKETAEVAHEALLREWPTLRHWLSENREGLRLHRQLTEATQEWERMRRDEGLAYRGARLAQATEWAAANPADLNQLEREFLEASRTLAQREAAEREAQRQRELDAAHRLAEAEKRRAEEQGRAALQLRHRAMYLTGAFVLALGMAGIAFFFAAQARQAALTAQAERDQATLERQVATSRELAAAAIANLTRDPERSILLALQAVSIADTHEATDALHQAVSASRVQFVITQTGLSAVAYSPDGRQLATASYANTTKLWDTAGGQELRSFQTGPVDQLVFSPDGTRLATSFTDLPVAKLWDTDTGEQLLSLSGHKAGINSIAFSPDGARLATASADGVSVVWDATAGEALLTLSGHDGAVLSVAFSPDGTRLVSGSDDGTSRVWDATTGQPLLSVPTVEAARAYFSPDGTRIATVGRDFTVRIWDATTAQPLLVLSGHSGQVSDLAFSPDGARLATASYDGTARIWQVGTGQELLALYGHSNLVQHVAFSPDGIHIATASDDGTARVWDVSQEGSREWLTFARHTDWVVRVAYSPDGTRLATASYDGTAVVLNAATGQTLQVLAGHTGAINGVAFSPDGTRLATASADRTAKVWDATSGRELLTLAGHGDGWVGGGETGVLDVAFSPDGTRLATAGADGVALVWDAETGAKLASFSDDGVGLTRVAFSPDGTRLLTVSDDETVGHVAVVTLWDLLSRQPVWEVTQVGEIWGVAFNPDGTRFATGAFGGQTYIWEAATGRPVLSLPGHANIVLDVAFSPNGTQLAAVSADGTARVWQAGTGEELLTLSGHSGVVSGLAFSPDGTRLATSGQDGTVRVYVLQISDLVALARSRLTRSLTAAECEQYLHGACP